MTTPSGSIRSAVSEGSASCAGGHLAWLWVRILKNTHTHVWLMEQICQSKKMSYVKENKQSTFMPQLLQNMIISYAIQI